MRLCQQRRPSLALTPAMLPAASEVCAPLHVLNKCGKWETRMISEPSFAGA